MFSMKLYFNTINKESLKTRWFRSLMNIFPVYRGTGGRIIFISSDWKETVVRLKLNWRTRNYVGTIFGGSLYAAADPILMLQLIKILGDKFVVWDKAAAVRFRRPGKGQLQMYFHVTEELLETIISKVKENGEYEFSQTLEWVGADSKVYTEVDKIIYVADKQFYKNKREKRKS